MTTSCHNVQTKTKYIQNRISHDSKETNIRVKTQCVSCAYNMTLCKMK